MRNWITIAVVVDILYIGGESIPILFLNLSTFSRIHDGTLSGMGSERLHKARIRPDAKSTVDWSYYQWLVYSQDAYNIDLWAPNRAGYLGISYRASFNEDVSQRFMRWSSIGWLDEQYRIWKIKPHLQIRQPDGSFVWSPPALMAIGIVLCLFGGTGEKRSIIIRDPNSNNNNYNHHNVTFSGHHRILHLASKKGYGDICVSFTSKILFRKIVICFLNHELSTPIDQRDSVWNEKKRFTVIRTLTISQNDGSSHTSDAESALSHAPYTGTYEN